MSKKGGHHGGAWKVAYADFVTAMMALFLVLWLTAQDAKIKEAVQRAFTNPFTSLTKESTGIIHTDTKTDSPSKQGAFESVNAVEMEMLRKIAEDLAKVLQQEADEKNTPVKIDMTPEGVRINIFDRSQKPIFEADTEVFTEYGNWVLSTLAWEISRYRTFKIELEGHTEVGHKSPKPEYTNWELSSDRANAARRKLTQGGVDASQVVKVAGFAETQPLAGVLPTADTNRRVSVLLKLKNSGKSI